jgi:hypothetical protein
VRFLFSQNSSSNHGAIAFSNAQFLHSQNQTAVSDRSAENRSWLAKGDYYGLPGCADDDAYDCRLRRHHRALPARDGLKARLKMFTVKLDQSRNTITISYGGQVTPDETRLCADEVRLALTILRPGFRLIVDLTELQSMEVACSPAIANIMEICNAAGVAEVMRIIPDPTRDIGLQIMSFFHYDSDVRILTCASAAEAGNVLEEES